MRYLLLLFIFSCSHERAPKESVIIDVSGLDVHYVTFKSESDHIELSTNDSFYFEYDMDETVSIVVYTNTNIYPCSNHLYVYYWRLLNGSDEVYIE